MDPRRPVGLAHLDNGTLLLVLANGGQRPVPRVHLQRWQQESGSYVGCYASWGAAQLHRSDGALHLDVFRLEDTDGGVRDEMHVVYVSTDDGMSWKPHDGDVPKGATVLATIEMERPKP